MRPGHAMLRRVHRWLGLSLGLVIALLGVTGSLLVFHRELDHFLLNRDLWRISGGAAGTPLTLAQLTERVRAQVPSGMSHGADRAPFFGSRPTGYWEEQAADGTLRSMTAALDPATGRIHGRFAWGELPLDRRNFTSVVYRLHYQLLAGETGTIVVGVIGIASLALVGIGLYLWWPAPGRWRQRLTLKPGAPPVRRNYDLHNVAGSTSAVVLVIVALSGTYMCFPDQFRAALGSTATVTQVEPLPPLGRLQPGSAETAEHAARHLLPEARYDSFSIGGPGQPIRMAFRESGDPRRELGSTRIDADPATGRLLRLRRPTDDTAADLVMRWQFPLHNGEALGLPGRIIVFVAGLVPAILMWTGFQLWRARRKAHHKAEVRRSTGVAPGAATAGLP